MEEYNEYSYLYCYLRSSISRVAKHRCKVIIKNKY